MTNKITEMLKIELPIIQGAMAWISDYSLVSAVSEAGGLGVIAAGNAPKEVLKEQIDKTREATNKPFAVNIMLISPFVEDIVDLVIEEKIEIVITGAGNPGKYMERFDAANITVIPVVPSVALAKRMEKQGCKALIAEGTEAGGHVGELTSMSLIPQVCDAVSIPVIGAGGVADNRGYNAMLALGAEAVQVGTRFLVAHECTVHQSYKDMVIDAKDTSAVVTGRKTGHPVRVLKNKLFRAYKKLEKENASIEEMEALGAGALRLSAIDGDVKNGSVMAGQVAGLIKKEESCSEIIKDILGL